MALAGDSADCVAYLMGNHIFAERLFRHDPRAMMYAPLHTVIWEDKHGDAWFTVDQPSKQFASFDNPDIAEVGIELDTNSSRCSTRSRWRFPLSSENDRVLLLSRDVHLARLVESRATRGTRAQVGSVSLPPTVWPDGCRGSRALQGSRASCPRCPSRNQSRLAPDPITGSRAAVGAAGSLQGSRRNGGCLDRVAVVPLKAGTQMPVGGREKSATRRTDACVHREAGAGFAAVEAATE
jgi:hypothetical protein